jgi:uncharacterized membrane protein YkvA (DUF1232 family)
MKFLGIARTLIRYWHMAHDPRTPKAVRYMIYGGLAYTLAPIDLLPDWIPGVGLLDDAAVLPSIIALSMIMIPQNVKDQHEAKEERGIAKKQAEGTKARIDDQIKEAEAR